MVHDAMLWEPIGQGRVRCLLCAHRCVIPPGKPGICLVRENRDGALVTLVYGEAVAAHIDPIEKKPLFHVLPGSRSFSLATVGCNFRCSFCQNWQISQVPRDKRGGITGEKLPPEEIVSISLDYGCRSISYTYTEPTIFFEYAHDTALLAKKAGLLNNFVTNGYLTPEAIEVAKGFLNAANIDLKFFRDSTYRKETGAHLQPVLDAIKLVKAAGIWLEVTTLVIPDLNDSQEELRDTARFIASVDVDIPWHISRFHPDYKFTSSGPTPLGTLKRAAEIGREEGLHYVYIGNVSGESEDTVCPNCGTVLIRRRVFQVLENKIIDSKCPVCGTKIPGIFE